MNKSISFEKILCFSLVLGVCFTFQIGNYKIGNYLIQQFIIIIPTLFLMFNYMLAKEYVINKSLALIIIIWITIFLMTSFKFGLTSGDLLSLMGFLILPLMVSLFNNINTKDYFLYYFLIIYTILEIVAIMIIIKEGAIFDIWRMLRLREVFYSWPNHFAMMSAIKYGSVLIIKRKGKNLKKLNILSIISIVTIFLSLSRTGIFMMLIIFIINNFISYIFKNSRIKMYKKVGLIILTVILVFVSKSAINSKNLSAGATTEKTMQARTLLWLQTKEILKENILIGTGFRSTVKYIGGNFSSMHNDYIDLLLKSGVIGFITIYGFFLHRTLILLRNKEYEIFSVVIAILAGSFVQNPLKNISIMVIFAIMLSYSYSSNNLHKKTDMKTSK